MADLQDTVFTLRLTEDGDVYRREAITPEGQSVRRELHVNKVFEQSSFFESFRTSGAAPSSSQIENVGRVLFDALFAGETLIQLYQAQGRYGKIQVRLEIESPTLETIPWEIINDEDGWLSTNTERSFVRSFGKRQFPIREGATPLRVFVAYASPLDLARSPIESMRTEIETFLEKLEQGNRINVTRKLNATINDLDMTLLPKQDIFLFAGHGGPGSIFLHDARSESRYPASPESLAQKINDNPPRLVFLASCQTSVANPDGGLGFAQGLWRMVPDIPALIAMQTYVDGKQAGRLAGKFLEVVTHGKPVDTGMNTAREELIRGAFPPTRDVFSAVLYLQSTTGDVFAMRDRPLEWFLPGDISLDGGSTWGPLTERMIAAYINAGFDGKGTVHRPADQYSGTKVALQEFCTSDKHDFVLATGELWSHTDYIGACSTNDHNILKLHAAYGQKDGGRSEPLHIYVAKSTLKTKRHVSAFLDFFFARINDQIPRFANAEITYTAIGSATLEEHRQTIKSVLNEDR